MVERGFGHRVRPFSELFLSRVGNFGYPLYFIVSAATYKK